MKQTHSFLLLVFLLSGLTILISCGELSTPGDPLSIQSNSHRQAYLDEPYTNLIRVSGGLSRYSYKVEKGSLPPGLSISDVGEIQGTPTKEGSYSFTVVVTDANLSKTFADMVLTVTQAPPAQLRLNLPDTEMQEDVFTVRPEILDARALQGFRAKINWDTARFNLVEGTLRSNSDDIIMFEKIDDGSFQVDIAVKGPALTGNHRLFTFALEPVQPGYVQMQGQVEFVNKDGKRGFQQINEGQSNPDDPAGNQTGLDQTAPDLTQPDADQIEDDTPKADEIENGSQNGQ